MPDILAVKMPQKDLCYLAGKRVEVRGTPLTGIGQDFGRQIMISADSAGHR